MEEKKNVPAPKRLKKPNRILRLLAMLVTAALILAAIILVLYRDTININTVKRWLAYQNMDTGITGESDRKSVV